MELFSTSTKKRETYEVELKYSLLWEAALGIAAVTNHRLLDTLDYSKKQWEEVRDSLSKETVEHLDFVQKHNTWKTILQLLHERDFENLSDFLQFVNSLREERLKYIAIPYLGLQYEEDRSLLSQGEEKAVERLREATKDNPFFPDYMTFISEMDTDYLKKHICEVMQGWMKGAVKTESERLEGMLKRDVQSKEQMKKKLGPEAFVEWATNGVRYLPEPSVTKVIMIPQHIYRPWNVEADLEGVKVFYYPVANESIYPEDPYVPSKKLVQKYKALGDENRLRMLKILTSGGRTLQEMTQEVGMGKTTVYHHLKLLKSARLIVSHGPRYQVNPIAWQSLAEELDLYLGDEK